MKYFKSIIIYYFFSNLLLEIISKPLGNNTGAYLKTPDPDKLQYRIGNALMKENLYNGHLYVPDLVKYAGYNTIRKQFKEIDFEDEKELIFLNRSKELGISDIIGYLTTPIKAHSSNKSAEKQDNYKPLNLYEPIWNSENEINPDNYWANYTFNAISKYKDYIKIWTVWFMPDFTNKFNNTKNWIFHPPNSSDLDHWNAPIFEFIRMLRITYEIAKKIDPDCWVSVGTLIHYEFLDALMRYTDNPNNGEIDNNYTDYGGAYFDCVGFVQYAKGEIIDIETNKTYNGKGSDSSAQIVIIAKKNFENIAKKYDFGIKYPKKIFINEKTGLNSRDSSGKEKMRKNLIIKLSLLSIEHDIKQIHNYNLLDSDNLGDGDYFKNLVVQPAENSFQYLKESSKVRQILSKIHLERYIFDNKHTDFLRKNLSENLYGIVLKRKFPKESDEEYDYDYIYSIWILCLDKEIEVEIEYQLNIPFNPLKIDFLENEINITNSSKIKISSTPVLLLGNIEYEENEKEEEKEKEKEEKNEKNEEENFINKYKYIIISCFVIILIIIVLLLLCRKLKKKQNNAYNKINEKINKIDLIDKYMD